MKKVWANIDRRNWRAKSKFRITALIAGIPAALAGCIVWAAIRPAAFFGPEWIVCFAGYPATAAWLAVFLYSCRHDFQDGSAGQ